MLLTSVYFLPCIICMLWFFSFLLRVKNERQRLFTVMQAADAFYFATYAFYISPITDYKIMLVMDVVNVPLVLANMAMKSVYLAMYWKQVRLNLLQLLLLAPALIVGTISNMFYFLIGFDNAALLTELLDKGEPLPAELNTSLYRIYEFFNYQFMSVVCLIFIAVIVYEIYSIIRNDAYPRGNIFRFLFKGDKSTPAHVIAVLSVAEIVCLMPLIILGRTYLMQNPAIGIVTTVVIAVAIHCISHIEYYSNNQKEISLYYLSHLKFGETNTADAENVQEEEQVQEEKHVLETHTSTRVRMIQEQLDHLLKDEKIYKDENLTLNQLADRFGIGRTTLSHIISSQYGMPFRDIVSHYRIEEAKAFMQENPKATQETVAEHCGFKNAQYFNTKFKEVVGETPQMWLTSLNISNPGTQS